MGKSFKVKISELTSQNLERKMVKEERESPGLASSVKKKVIWPETVQEKKLWRLRNLQNI